MKKHVSVFSLLAFCCMLALFLASCGGSGDASNFTSKTPGTPPVNPAEPSQTLDTWTDESTDSSVPVTDLLMAKIATTSTNAGAVLTSTEVEVIGTLTNVTNIKTWWNIVDNFETATLVGTQDKPVIGESYDIALGSAGKDSGFLFYSISLPLGQSGNFQLTVSNVKGATDDKIPLPQTTVLRNILVDGSVKSIFNTSSSITSSPAIGADGTIYFGSDDNFLYAINPDSTFKWRFGTGGAIKASPAIGNDGTIYVGSIDRQIYAINPNGTLKWVIPTKSNFTSSPALGHDGTIYVGGTHQDKLALCRVQDKTIEVQVGFLYAVDPSGFIKWSGTLSGAVDSSPAIAPDGTIYIGSDGDILYDRVNPCDPNSIFPPSTVNTNVPVGGHFYAFNPAGTIKWDFKTLADVDSSPAIAPDGTIYVGSDGQQYIYNLTSKTDEPIALNPTTEGFLYAIHPSGTLKWLRDLYGDVDSSPAIGSDGTIYVGSDKNDFFAVNPNGSIKWAFPTRDDINSSPAIANDGTIYVGSNDANLYAFNPDGTVKWQFTAGGAVQSSPSIGIDGTVYVGSNDANFYSVGGEDILMNSIWPKFRRDLRNTGRQ